MGVVVKLKPKFPADAQTRRLKRLEAKVAELKAHNKVLVKLLRDPYNKNVLLQNARLKLINERMWIENGTLLRDSPCTCTPDRASFLQAIRRD